MPTGSRDEKDSAVIGNSSDAASIVLREKLKGSNSEEAVTAEHRAAVDKILRARPIEGEIDHGKLTRRIISRFPKILAELAK
jgi:hypothetical protein